MSAAVLEAKRVVARVYLLQRGIKPRVDIGCKTPATQGVRALATRFGLGARNGANIDIAVVLIGALVFGALWALRANSFDLWMWLHFLRGRL